MSVVKDNDLLSVCFTRYQLRKLMLMAESQLMEMDNEYAELTDNNNYPTHVDELEREIEESFLILDILRSDYIVDELG